MLSWTLLHIFVQCQLKNVRYSSRYWRVKLFSNHTMIKELLAKKGNDQLGPVWTWSPELVQEHLRSPVSPPRQPLHKTQQYCSWLYFFSAKVANNVRRLQEQLLFVQLRKCVSVYIG